MAISMDAGKFDVLDKIGHGSFGIIRKVKRKTDGKVLCRKEINYLRMSQKEREQLHAEFSILSSLRHPNIVAYYHREHLKSTQDLYIYMEYCGGGDLSKVIKNLATTNQYAEEEFVWSIFAQLVTALYRCHYGVDPPEVGKNVMKVVREIESTGLRPKNQIMILHRDLKPENVFLGEDNSVKLGDFGLSKLMQSHDFASTYVGTPFYMSPEICAAEKYTLRSDIWSLGCIMYELCARVPPFNAKTHFHLVQKIKEGRYEPLPSFYSPELQATIKSCLSTNPSRRPTTKELLNLPIIRLMRKEREVVEIGKCLKTKEEEALLKSREAEALLANLDKDKVQVRADLEATVRREWEVKARLEIDRQIDLGKERLQKIFDTELAARVEQGVAERILAMQKSEPAPSDPQSPTIPVPTLSSISTAPSLELESPLTDFSSLSFNSPTEQRRLAKANAAKRPGRTPFSRARTQFDSPMDVAMVEASPMSIASLSLSPRRAAALNAGIPHHNPFNAAAVAAVVNNAADRRTRWQPQLMSSLTSENESEDDDADGLPELPSPTRLPRTVAAKDPFKANTRPGLRRQSTLPINRLPTQPSLFNARGDPAKPQPPSPTSPTRRPGGRAGFAKAATTAGGEDMHKAVTQKNVFCAGTGVGGVNAAPNAPTTTAASSGGRTLVELNQARSAATILTGAPLADAITQGMKWEVERAQDVPVWDPERDEDMPSPFLVRGRRGVVAGR